jgi:hypothetical protein
LGGRYLDLHDGMEVLIGIWHQIKVAANADKDGVSRRLRFGTQGSAASFTYDD